MKALILIYKDSREQKKIKAFRAFSSRLFSVQGTVAQPASKNIPRILA
jgi:hypothetical protein